MNFMTVSGVIKMQTASKETPTQNPQGGMSKLLPSESLSPEIFSESMENPGNPPHLIVNLTKEEWTEVQVYVLPSKKEDQWEFYTDPDRMTYEGVNIYLHVALSFQELHWETRDNDVYVLALPSSERVIPVRFFLAADGGQGKVLWERSTQSLGSSSTPGRSFFQRQLPLDHRAQRLGQKSRQNHPEPHPATRAEHLLDEDWDQAYTDSLHWGGNMGSDAYRR